MLRLGGAKRKFIPGSRQHSCGACEAQKRPAGPIASRSPNSLTCFFSNTYEKHTLPTKNIVRWGAGLQRVVPLRDQSGETLRNAYRNNWLRSYGRPRILVVDQQRSLCSGIFAEKVVCDGTRLEVTPWKHHGGMVRQNVQERTERKTIIRQRKTAPKRRRGRILKRTVMS